MATRYSQERPTQGSSRNAYGTPSRPAQRSAGARPPQYSGQRSSQQRPVGARPAQQRPSGQRPAGGQRPPQRPGQRPPQRRKKKAQNRFYLILAALAVVVIGIVLLVLKLAGVFGGGDPVATPPVPTAVPVQADAPDETQPSTVHSDALAAMLADSDAQVTGLSADQMAVVTDLSINQNLSDEWMNILLLGSDERVLGESARTDSMIICSINLQTGEVKLTSIMRDLAVRFDDIGQYNGTYRINAANFFGGEQLAMRTVNECFGLNIQHYVRVNFYGFQQVAHLLGGIDIDITEAEMNEINYRIYEVGVEAYYNGIDDNNLPREYLETYGPNTHLDGRQTLAYARIRKIDSDYARAERQRKVLVALMNKLQGAGAGDLLAIGAEAMNHFRTNLTLDEILGIAIKVCSSGLTNVESFRLPMNGTYVQEERNNDEMFYDCDWAANTRELHNFIYG